jgi:hypothetical protein
MVVVPIAAHGKGKGIRFCGGYGWTMSTLGGEARLVWVANADIHQPHRQICSAVDKQGWLAAAINLFSLACVLPELSKKLYV